MTDLTTISAEDLATDALKALLNTQLRGEAAVRLDSPAGAGKTYAVERVAALCLGHLNERCIVATPTNEQAFDLARRLAMSFPRLSFHLFVKDGLPLPPSLQAGFPNLTIVRSGNALPTGPCVVIANAAKWAWAPATQFDVLIVDEAFQLADYRFIQIAGLAKRIVLVGDPGQIPPVVTTEIERWRDDPAGPHVPCPDALLLRHPNVVRRLTLPVSRRLVPDTVSLVQPAFYPDLPFRSACAPGERSIRTTGLGVGSPADQVINHLRRGQHSLVLAQLPARVVGELDEELAQAIVDLLDRLLRLGVTVCEPAGERRVSASEIGVVCAHVSQVAAVRERLPRHASGVLVETAERFQGLERDIMIVHHPLSGRTEATEFHLETGRLCVMLTRHRAACFVLGRGGIEDMLLRHAPAGNRILGVRGDPEFEGWRAHLRVVEAFKNRNAIVSWPVNAS